MASANRRERREQQRQSAAPTQGGIRVLSFADVQLPTFYENKAKGEYVLYGKENDYPRYLIDLYNSSPIHGAIINGKVDYVCAGWTYDSRGLTLEDRARIDAFINAYGGSESLDNKTREGSIRHEILNWFTYEVIWDKAGKDFSFKPIPTEDVRVIIDENGDVIEYAYTSRWYYITEQGLRKKSKAPEDEPDYTIYQPFDPENRSGAQMYVHFEPKIGSYVYPLPNYKQAIESIEIDARLQKNDLNEVANGFSPSVMINIPGAEYSDEKKRDAIEEKIKETSTGQKGKRFVLNFVSDISNKATVEEIPLPTVDRFTYVQEAAEQKIFTAHGVTSPMLFGIKTEGQLGGRDELDVAEDMFVKRYARNRRKPIEQMVNTFARLKGIKVTLSLGGGIDKSVQLADAINALSPLVANKVLESMDLNEIRALAKLPAVASITKPQTPTTFSSQQPCCTGTKKHVETFAKHGRSRSEFTVISSRAMDISEYSDVQKSEQTFLSAWHDSEIVISNFAESGTTISIKSLDRVVLDLLSKSPSLTASEIAKAAKAPEAKVQASIDQLTKSGYLKSVSDGLTPTATGQKVIDNAPAKTAEIEVLYSYEVAPGMGKPILPKDENGNERTREFCRDLIELDRMYTKEEILSMENDFGGSAWLVRGGWYTKPGTTIAVPQCRHIWVQNIVTR